jgi:hypothetical protein
MTPLERGQLMSDEQYLEAIESYGDEFDARMGAEAIHEMLHTLELQKEVVQVREGINATSSEAKIKRLSKRLKLIEAFLESGNRPEWMVMTVLPVLPPDLRPLVPLDFHSGTRMPHQEGGVHSAIWGRRHAHYLARLDSAELCQPPLHPAWARPRIAEADSGLPQCENWCFSVSRQPRPVEYTYALSRGGVEQ